MAGNVDRERVATGTAMVLLLDDDDDFRLALAANLTDDGHSVRHFARPADIDMPVRGEACRF